MIVIPAHNEAGTIAEVVAGASRHGAVVVVDDASHDGTGDIAAAAGAEVVRLERNRGYEGAIEAGFARAAQMGAAAVVTFDGDGQLDPDRIGALLAPIREAAADLVLGTRPRPARAAEALFNLYARIRYGVDDILCGAKAYRMELYRRHGRFDGARTVGTELALSALRRGVRWRAVPVTVEPRRVGHSRYGRRVRANLKILGALLRAVRMDLRAAGNP